MLPVVITSNEVIGNVHEVKGFGPVTDHQCGSLTDQLLPLDEAIGADSNRTHMI